MATRGSRTTAQPSLGMLTDGPSSVLQGATTRSINFQFLNRQLLWEHFTQLALCALPLVDWDALRRRVSGLIRQRRSNR
jgi:hypothetical protein